jgi:hypothetical protein
MANTQTSVPVFTAGQVLTAAQQNQINTGIPVFADSTARDAAFGGTGEKTLAEGQFAFLEDSNTTQYYDGATWQSVGVTPGLRLVTTGTMSAVASVTVNTCFTSTYDEYFLLIDVLGSTNATLTMQMRNAGSTITAGNYQWYRTGRGSGGEDGATQLINTTSWTLGFLSSAIKSSVAVNIYGPLDNTNPMNTVFSNTINAAATQVLIYSIGLRYSVDQVYDSFVLATSSGTMTGTVRVYGYTK